MDFEEVCDCITTAVINYAKTHNIDEGRALNRVFEGLRHKVVSNVKKQTEGANNER